MHPGIQNIIIVTGRGKTAIEDHFDVSFELEYLLETRNKKELLAIVRSISDMIDVSYVRQKEALGLGHAVLRASELVGEEPFAVVLADDVIDAETPCLRQLLDVYEFLLRARAGRDGSAAGEHLLLRRGRRRAGVAQRLERPRLPHPRPGGEAQAAEAPSNLAIIGRYVLTPEIFDSLQAIEPGAGGEIQLTDGAAAPAAQPPDLRPTLRGHPLRRRRQARLPEGHRGVRPATATTWARQFRQYLKEIALVRT